MAIIKKFSPNQIYFSKKLDTQLKTIYDYPVTIIETPTGYGKTTVIRKYLNSLETPFIWFNIDTDNKEKCFNDFCAKIKTINEKVYHKIMTSGYPHDKKSCNQIVNALNEIKYNQPTVFVIDNYHLMADKYLNDIVKDLSGSADKNVRIVILTRLINSNTAFELIINRKINYLSKSYFELSKEDIFQYYKICGIKLDDNETDFLFEYTKGWISALYLLMISYNSSKIFEQTTDIENLIGKAIWYDLDSKSQEFLIGLSVFSRFTLRQCIYFANKRIEDKQIESLLSKSGLIIYDTKEGKYFIHPVLQCFLEKEFKKMEVIFQKKILKDAAAWYYKNENHVEALAFYYKLKDFESILSINCSIDDLFEINSKKECNHIFLNITSDISYNLKCKHLKNYMLYVYFLFINNKKDYYERECDVIKEIIDTEYANNHNQNEFLGEYYVLKSFLSFNDLDLMKTCFEKAFELLKKPSRIISSRNALLFACPSPMALYYNISGGLNGKVMKMDEIMPVYYRLTNGKSKGIESLLRAEMLLARGELLDSLKLCDKTIYMSSSREQIDVYIGALMTICRISYLRGDIQKLNSSLEEMSKILEDNDRDDLLILCDMCLGLVNITINNIDKMPVWLAHHYMIEKNTTILTLGFANLIYGRYLLLKEEYIKFLGISGQMLGVAGIFNNIIYKVYTLIYISISKSQTGEREKAKEILIEAIDLSKADNIFIPFVECFNMIDSMLDEIRISGCNIDFIKKVNMLAKKYIKGLKTAQKESYEDKRYGLTKREMEVAKLASMRLSNKEIAEQLFIAESTVKSNLKVIFNKLGINSRTELKNYF